MDKIKKILGHVDRGAAQADDFIQGGIRDHILRLPNDGSRLPQDARFSGIREALGVGMHQSSDPNAKTFYRQGGQPGDGMSVLGARAAQAGGLAGITAAGAALLNTGEGLKEASKGPLYDFTDEDRQVMKDVQTALIDGSLDEVTLHDIAKAGAFTKPQLLLISDIHDWSRLGSEHYPFGNQSIMEALSP